MPSSPPRRRTIPLSAGAVTAPPYCHRSLSPIVPPSCVEAGMPRSSRRRSRKHDGHRDERDRSDSDEAQRPRGEEEKKGSVRASKGSELHKKRLSSALAKLHDAGDASGSSVERQKNMKGREEQEAVAGDDRWSGGGGVEDDAFGCDDSNKPGNSDGDVKGKSTRKFEESDRSNVVGRRKSERGALLEEDSAGEHHRVKDGAREHGAEKQTFTCNTEHYGEVMARNIESKTQDSDGDVARSKCNGTDVRVPDEMGMEQILSDLQALKRLYGLLHRGQADENLDATSRALLMKMLDDATQHALLRQAKMLSPALERKLSIQSDRRTRDAEPRLGLKPIASPNPRLHANETSHRLTLQSSVRSRDGHRNHDHRFARDECILAHVASNRSSRTTMPLHHPNPEQRLARLGSRCSSRAARTHRSGENKDRSHRITGCGDHSSLERSGRCHSVSREPSTQGLARVHSRATDRHVGAKGSSTHRFGMMDYAATSKQSSSSNGTVTIRGCIRPKRELMECSLRRADEESPPRRRRNDSAVAANVGAGLSSRPRRTLNQIDFGITYNSSSSGAASSFASTSPTVLSTLDGDDSASSSVLSRRGNAQLDYALEISTTSRNQRRRERQERREGRLRRLKNNLALVFHHRHDHHHHLGRGRSGSQDGLSRRERRATNHRMSPWRYLGGVFHRAKGNNGDKNTTSRTVVSVPGKRRGGGGHVHALFDALVRHMWGAPRRVPARAMMRTGSRAQVKKLHWWQRPRRRRGRAEVAGSSRPRRCLGQGK